MMAEKFECCPQCGEGGKRWLYDGQYCEVCNYSGIGVGFKPMAKPTEIYNRGPNYGPIRAVSAFDEDQSLLDWVAALPGYAEPGSWLRAASDRLKAELDGLRAELRETRRALEIECGRGDPAPNEPYVKLPDFDWGPRK